MVKKGKNSRFHISVISRMCPGWNRKFFSTWHVFYAGSLRIEPASPQLWYALGTTSNNKDIKQYAFIRALQLDPKHTASWVSLGRLYMENKEKNLAAQCLTNARSHDPTASIIWESMAKLAEHSSSGKKRIQSSFHQELTRNSPKTVKFLILEGNNLGSRDLVRMREPLCNSRIKSYHRTFACFCEYVKQTLYIASYSLLLWIFPYRLYGQSLMNQSFKYVPLKGVFN